MSVALPRKICIRGHYTVAMPESLLQLILMGGLPVSMLALLAATLAMPVPQIHAQVDVPSDLGPQQVVVQTREFAPGSESGWHVHDGIEVAYVISGEMELVTAGGVRRLMPGDSFIMPRGMAHNGINRGVASANAAITLVVDKDRPLRRAVSTPGGDN